MRNGHRTVAPVPTCLLILLLLIGLVSCTPAARPSLPLEEEQEAVDAGPKAAQAESQPRPSIPRHYQHIRIAALAYHGNPLGQVEANLLHNSVDLVIAHPDYLQRIYGTAPKTPQLLYSNTSNLYLDLLIDWLVFADAQGVPREAAFYHAAVAKPFKGHSASSLPVTWFWRVWRGQKDLTPLTTPARGSGQPFTLGELGESVYLGHPDRFREINLAVQTAAGQGWKYQFEYCCRLGATGEPAEWKVVKLLGDGTQGVVRSGALVFDPPSDWKPASIKNTGRLYYVRLRTTQPGTVPSLASILGRDYVEARGRQEGVVPVFDRTVDVNGDGYLNDFEYARRAAGKNARFIHESRMVTQYYGQMRFGTNPASQAFRDWAAAYHKRLLEKHPRASGFFVDNSGGKSHLQAEEVLEPLDRATDGVGQVLAAVRAAIAPRWLLANVAGGGKEAEEVLKHNPAYFEEFGLKPLAQHHQQFEALRDLLEQRAQLSDPAPLAVLDSHPQNGSPDDPRTQLATLAEYYLLADPQNTFLVFFGGFEPATTWQRHWSAAAARDVGPPLGRSSEKTRGPDPANAQLEYRVYQRGYQNALVLYRPLSHATGRVVKASLDDDSAVRIDLGDAYRPLRADNTLGEVMRAVSLRNGEGTILMRTK